MHSKVATFALLATVAVAQQTGTSVYPPFDSASVTKALRHQWCVSQKAACPLLCADRGFDTTANQCYEENLFYQCTCSDGIAPDLKKYSQTVPFYQCSFVVERCVDNCKGGAICAANCRKDLPCGAETPKPSNKTTTAVSQSTASSTSTTPPGSFQTGFANTGNKATTENRPSSAPAVKSATVGLLLAGLGVGITLFL
jgi:hypothetical protein